MPFKSLTKQSLSKLFLKGCQEDLKKFICETEINFEMKRSPSLQHYKAVENEQIKMEGTFISVKFM